MSLIIQEKKSIEGFEEYYRDYLKNYRKVADEKEIEEAVKRLQSRFAEKKGHLFQAKINDKIVGHIYGVDSGIVFEVNSFYVNPESYSFNCGSELVKTITAKAFEIGYKHFRQAMNLLHNKESTFEKNLENDDYLIFTRFGMIKELRANDDYTFTLPEGYSFEPFSIEKADEIIQVIVDSNPKGHTDFDIYPEMRDVNETKKIFGQFSNNFKDFDPEINPQIVFDGKIIGISCIMKQGEKKAFVAEVSIVPEHQRKGLGKALMKKIMQACLDKGCNRLGLAVTKDNIGAYKLYQNLGFKDTSEFLAIIKHKENL